MTVNCCWTVAHTTRRPRGTQKKAGVQVVHQEFNLLSAMSVAENVCVEGFPARAGIIDRRGMQATARAALDRVGLTEVPVTVPIEQLGIAHRQLIEIARAIQNQGRILILDEPTATLTTHESQKLFDLVAELSAKGVSIILVSHHLNEILDHCDRVTVMRNGATVFTKPIGDTNEEDLIQGMVGRRLGDQLAQAGTSRAGAKVVMSVKNLRVPASPNAAGISFDLHEGEILGIAGLVGAGRTEVMRAIFGADIAVSGSIALDGRECRYSSPRQAIADGLAFVTEDRRDEGVILSMPIASNVSLANMAAVSRAGIIDRRREADLAQTLGQDLRLKYGQLQDSVSTLSGGNQQKVVLAKWLARNPKILLLDEPTRGVDVGAKAEIYDLLRQLAKDGKSLLIVSSELYELMALCDRILVMASHTITGELARADFSEEQLLTYAYKTGQRT